MQLQENNAVLVDIYGDIKNKKIRRNGENGN